MDLQVPSTYKSSLQTLEGKLALAANVVYFVGIAAAAVIDIALKQAVFAHYANQLTGLSIALLAFNGYYARIRTNYKTAFIQLVAPILPAGPPDAA